jgi:Tetracyclin repressor-like, C-terminal domain
MPQPGGSSFTAPRIACSHELVSGDRDERFEVGLDVLIQGLATQAAA